MMMGGNTEITSFYQMRRTVRAHVESGRWLTIVQNEGIQFSKKALVVSTWVDCFYKAFNKHTQSIPLQPPQGRGPPTPKGPRLPATPNDTGQSLYKDQH